MSLRFWHGPLHIYPKYRLGNELVGETTKVQSKTIEKMDNAPKIYRTFVQHKKTIENAFPAKKRGNFGELLVLIQKKANDSALDKVFY